MLPALRPAILLVDDDPTLLSVLARRLTREGFDVRTAASGQAALAGLDRSWPALVVVDVMMPGMDGFELCRRIKRIADLPIIVLSAVDAGEAKVLALQEYAEDYIVKPFDPDELVARVQRIMRRASTRLVPVLALACIALLTVGAEAQKPGGTPDAKRALARGLVSWLHSEQDAEEAERHFDRVFVQREAPEEIAEAAFSAGGGMVHIPAVIAAEFGISRSEARRLIDQGGVVLGDAPLAPGEHDVPVARADGQLLKVGRRRFRRLKAA